VPIYVFYDTEKDETVEHIMSYTKLDEFKQNNPHLKQQITAMNIIGGTGDRVKTDAGMKEVLSKIGDAHPGSPVHERHGTKNIKREKSVNIVKKHIDKQSKTK